MAEKIYEQIYDENKDYIYRFALKLTGGDTTNAEELTQETFYNAFVSFSRFRGECDIRTWLCQIMKNIFYRQFRKRIKQICFDDSERELLKNYYNQDLQEMVENKSIYKNIIYEINKLKPKQRDVITLRLFSELSFSQIANLLKISENSAKVIYHRAKNTLQKKLREEYSYD